MKLFNQLLNNKFDIFDKLSLLLFTILPISLIIGNASTNINILLIDLLFLIYCFKFKIWNWLKNDIFLYLMAIYIFLNLNSLYSYFILFENQTKPFWLNGVLTFYNDDIVLRFYENEGIKRSFLFIKFILLVFAFKVLLKEYKILDLINKSWLFIITILILDVFYEKYTGANILGNISLDGTRIVSFFKDEMIVGAFIFCFGFTSITYFMNNIKNTKLTLLIITIFILIPLSIMLSGEKSNFIKSIILFFSLIYFLSKNYHYFNFKKILVSFFFLISLVFIFSDTIRGKYLETYKRIFIVSENQKSISNNLQIRDKIRYFAHYDVAIKIFKNYPISGVGNKNFRNECFKKEYLRKHDVHIHKGCITHPHQIHFEILSEQGILGYFLILSFFVWFSIKNIKISIRKKNIHHLSNALYVLIFFIPLLPGAGIFGTFNGALFWIIFSLTHLNYQKK